MEKTRQQQELEKKQKQTEEMSLQMMQTLSTTIEAKDEYTCGHSHRVAEYAALIAAELGWSPEQIQQLKHAAYLHDIGKIGIPEQILNKPSRLTDEEFNLIKQHTIIGAEILKDITFIPYIIEVSRSHHERYDGCGYPDGLKGTDIPVHARIVAVADSYDAMNSRRIYRNALPPEIIREELEKNRGKQ
ncbi:TPA: HD-GYP domain-containing protein, partial [Pasteurella multocida]|nr:HD-GYP domain-containing protein [Pasteurella multocida]